MGQLQPYGIYPDALQLALFNSSVYKDGADTNGISYLLRWGELNNSDGGITLLPHRPVFKSVVGGGRDLLVNLTSQTQTILSEADANALVGLPHDFGKSIGDTFLISTPASTAVHESLHAMLFWTQCYKFSRVLDDEEQVSALDAAIYYRAARKLSDAAKAIDSARALGAGACVGLLRLENQFPVAQFTLTYGNQTVTQGQQLSVVTISEPISVALSPASAVDADGNIVGGEVSIDGQPAYSFTGKPTINLSLHPGSHTIVVAVLDDSGSRSSAQATAVVLLNHLPTAGFLMGSGSQPARNGQTLNLIVSSGGSATVSFDGSAPTYSSDPDGTVQYWSWLIDGTEVSTLSTFSRSFTKGTYQISLFVGDNTGTFGSAATGTVMVSESTPTVTADYAADFQGPTPKPGWAYLWNSGGSFGDPSNYSPLVFCSSNCNLSDGVQIYDFDGGPLPRATPAFDVSLAADLGHPGQGSSQGAVFDRFAIAAYTFSRSGHYRITGSSLTRLQGTTNGDIQLLVNVDRGPLLVNTRTTGVSTFDIDLGILVAGQTIYVAVGPDDVDFSDTFSLQFQISQDAASSNQFAASDGLANWPANDNPNWRYGYSLTLGSAFVPFTIADRDSGIADLPYYDRSHSCVPNCVDDKYPRVVFNNTQNTVVDGRGLIIPSGYLDMAAGPSGYGVYSVARFLAPAAGTYQIQGLFQGLELVPFSAISADVHILKNGNASTELFSSYITLGSPQSAFDLSVTLNAGDIIDFMVGDGGNGHPSDSIGLSAKLIKQ